ncbi:MAG TPA: NAD(+)/NADH kinase [Gemmatimonadales bacterium]|nr:NAD(+)/NADH kinase [Gemmatimonadales bacterium]
MAEVALVYQPALDGALPLAERCATTIEKHAMQPSLVSSRDVGPELKCADLSLALTFGGDGTILRTARWLAGSAVPIIGVRMGRLGFLAELEPSDLPGSLGPYLAGDYWLDHRAMLHAAVTSTGVAGWEATADQLASQAANPQPTPEPQTFVALNDIVVGRGQSVRTVTVDLSLEGHVLHRFRCDGLIVATATGSTAYSFAAGGPILAPASSDLVVTAICPHISSLRSLVMPSDSPLRLQVWAPEMAMVTIDGQIDHLVGDGSVVETRLSQCTTAFARRGTSAEFYSRLLAKLD